MEFSKHSVRTDLSLIQGPKLPVGSELELAILAAKEAAYLQFFGSPSPSPESIQTKLDQIYIQVNKGDNPGHFGSFESNNSFARNLRVVLKILGDYKLQCPKTGRPGMLYHVRSSGCPAGRFSMKVEVESGKSVPKFMSVKLPRLILNRS